MPATSFLAVCFPNMKHSYEINRLKMENELLRDFMRSMERK